MSNFFLRGKIFIFVHIFFITSFLLRPVYAAEFSMGGMLWNRIDASAVGLQFEFYHRFWGKEKNAHFDMHFKFPLMFRFEKSRPFFLPGIEMFPKRAKVNSLDEISKPVYLSYYIEQLHYRYKNFHIGLEPAQAHFLHNGLILRENPLGDKNFARYTPAFFLYVAHSENDITGIYSSEIGQSGTYLFYGTYKPLKNSQWYLGKEFRVSPLFWSDFTPAHKIYKELGAGLEVSTVAIKKNNFSFGMFTAFTFIFQPTQKINAHRFVAGMEFHSRTQIFALGAGMRSKNHPDAPPVSEFYSLRRDEILSDEKNILPSFVFFTNPKEEYNKGFRLFGEIYFIQPSYSYRLEYFHKAENLTFRVGHGRENLQKFLDLKNFHAAPTYFLVALEGSLLDYIHIHWQTRYYYFGEQKLTSYAAFTFTLLPRFSKKIPAQDVEEKQPNTELAN